MNVSYPLVSCCRTVPAPAARGERPAWRSRHQSACPAATRPPPSSPPRTTRSTRRATRAVAVRRGASPPRDPGGFVTLRAHRNRRKRSTSVWHTATTLRTRPSGSAGCPAESTARYECEPPIIKLPMQLFLLLDVIRVVVVFAQS